MGCETDIALRYVGSLTHEGRTHTCAGGVNHGTAFASLEYTADTAGSSLRNEENTPIAASVFCSLSSSSRMPSFSSSAVTPCLSVGMPPPPSMEDTAVAADATVAAMDVGIIAVACCIKPEGSARGSAAAATADSLPLDFSCRSFSFFCSFSFCSFSLRCSLSARSCLQPNRRTSREQVAPMRVKL